ncbi:MFS transporter [Sphingomonas sp. CGMCC 1.13654]|uniref:MFS transporter n=1 Tax=Sphingomonas chungangi TaxID=2683589 RepID=A0A838LAH5_9SPHN|nr:MFS transporter [Sphingomonas chungangi]MBA2935589.1 MFS transporter [Sphingomonas chungangi]MVW54280.1 MFS transporter [Sphingomonas chungangi]
MRADADAHEIERRPIAPPLYLFTGSLAGSTQGFVTVTLGFVLAQRGFTSVAIAGLVGLRLLPETWRVVFGPVLDLSLTPRIWFMLSALAAAACTGLLGFLPLQSADTALLGLLALAMGIFSNICIVAQTAGIAATTAPHERGRIAGWTSGGNLAGVGIGGGIGLWTATHVGTSVSALVIAGWCVLCAWPMLLIRTPRACSAKPLPVVARGLADEVVALASSRRGMLTILSVTLPMGLGAFLGLLPSISGDWHASADLTASTTGVLAGLASVPGCLLGGALCHRRPPQMMLAASSVACALGEIMMALGPRTPLAFVLFTLLNNVLVGVSYATVSAVVYAGLRERASGTIGALLGSLSNVPVVAMTFTLGFVGERAGAAGMMATEAMMGVTAALIYGAMAWLWRPRAAEALAAA